MLILTTVIITNYAIYDIYIYRLDTGMLWHGYRHTHVFQSFF
jgi:hypothetical protein